MIIIKVVVQTKQNNTSNMQISQHPNPLWRQISEQKDANNMQISQQNDNNNMQISQQSLGEAHFGVVVARCGRHFPIRAYGLSVAS